MWQEERDAALAKAERSEHTLSQIEAKLSAAGAKATEVCVGCANQSPANMQPRDAWS